MYHRDTMYVLCHKNFPLTIAGITHNEFEFGKVYRANIVKDGTYRVYGKEFIFSGIDIHFNQYFRILKAKGIKYDEKI